MDFDATMLMKSFFAFAFVMSLMFLFSWLLRRFGFSGQALLPGAKRRLKIVEHLPIDSRRKLVLVRRDDREHLLVIGPNGETVVEAGIPVKDNVVEISLQKDVVNG